MHAAVTTFANTLVPAHLNFDPGLLCDKQHLDFVYLINNKDVQVSTQAKILPVSGKQREEMTSGDPLENISNWLPPIRRTITDILCRLDENVN